MMNYRNAKFVGETAIEMEIDHPVYGWLPFTAKPDDVELLGREMYALALLGDVAPLEPLEPAPPVETEPVRIACVLQVSVIEDTVMAVGGSFRVAAMIYLDTGTFLAVFSQDLGPSEPYVIPNNGVSISIAEWGGDYAIFEIRDHAGGSLTTPSTFGFSLYNF